jgi:very-short-patch-repair endonuclease
VAGRTLPGVARDHGLPDELFRIPFTLHEARRAGLDLPQLRGASWMRLAPATYAWRGLGDDPIHRLRAVVRRLPEGAAFSGRTSVWLHGARVDPCHPVEATIPPEIGVSARSGALVRRSDLDPAEIVQRRGLPATTLARALAEVSSRSSLTESVVVADEALHRRLITLDELGVWATENRGFHGIRRLRKVIEHAEPLTESPMESRLRMLLVLGGLPRPKAQVTIGDVDDAIGRIDLYYEAERLGIEYDGELHRGSLTDDLRRQNALLSLGIRLLRFTSRDVFGGAESVVGQVRGMLNATSAGKYRRT